MRAESAFCLPTAERVKLSRCTTYGLGGEAEIYYPDNLCKAKLIFDKLNENGRAFVLGNGSDVLASDGKIKEPIICTKKLRGIVRVAEDKIFCLAGTSVGALLAYCKRRNLGGLEYLVNIPATIGGIAYMNGGAGGKYISDNVLSVKVYNGNIVTLDNKDCNYTYKHSTMRDINAIILSILLKVYPSTRQKIEERLSAYSARRAHLPTGRSCGCVFKNPQGDYAARLIEMAGMKGQSCGGAYVSPVHANFIISDGGSAEDVCKLIELVREAVWRKFGVLLENEVVLLGDFEACKS